MSEVTKETPKSVEEAPKSFLSRYKEFASPRVSSAVIIGGILGASQGYFVGGKAVIHSYSGGIGFGIVSMLYYFGTYTMHQLRNVDDIANHLISGAVNGAVLFGTMSGRRKIPTGAAVGAMVAGAFFLSTDSLYDQTRESYISSRAHRILNSKPRTTNMNSTLVSLPSMAHISPLSTSTDPKEEK